MNKAYIFDVWETLVDTPEWNAMLENDPELRALSEKAKTDVPSKRELVRKFDVAVQAGKLQIKKVDGVNRILDEILQQDGEPVAFSSGSNFTNRALLEGSDIADYFNPLLIISDADTLNVSKSEKGAYIKLYNTLRALGLITKIFVDNTERNVQAAAKSPFASEQSLYHFDRKASGLTVPEQKEGYVRIASLDQMKELRRR